MKLSTLFLFAILTVVLGNELKRKKFRFTSRAGKKIIIKHVSHRLATRKYVVKCCGGSSCKTFERDGNSTNRRTTVNGPKNDNGDGNNKKAGGPAGAAPEGDPVKSGPPDTATNAPEAGQEKSETTGGEAKPGGDDAAASDGEKAPDAATTAAAEGGEDTPGADEEAATTAAGEGGAPKVEQDPGTAKDGPKADTGNDANAAASNGSAGAPNPNANSSAPEASNQTQNPLQSNVSVPGNLNVPSNMSIPSNFTMPPNMSNITMPQNMTIPPDFSVPPNMSFSNPSSGPAPSSNSSSNNSLPSNDTATSANGTDAQPSDVIVDEPSNSTGPPNYKYVVASKAEVMAGVEGSKDDDKNYSEKGLDPPSDYMDPESPPKPNPNTVKPKVDPCIDDQCVMPCEKDSKYFPSGTLKVDATKGVIATVCGKKYFFSEELKMHAEAHKECCAMGMRLVSIETRTEEDCLIKHNRGVMKKWRLYWTSATDKSCAKQYYWCTGTAVNQKLMDWRFFQPNYLPRQHCLTMVLRYGWQITPTFFWPADNGLNDKECFLSTNYICEE